MCALQNRAVETVGEGVVVTTPIRIAQMHVVLISECILQSARRNCSGLWVLTD